MQTMTFHQKGANRFLFAFELCTPALGWAALETPLDGYQFGNWAHPAYRALVSYAEGNVTVLTAETDEEFSEAVRAVIAWGRLDGGVAAIDPMASPEVVAEFARVGLADLVH
jgi:hypothetical protein